MKLTKQQQNGMLFMLYLDRAGQCKTSDAAEQLGISCHFLEQITRKLRIAGLLTSIRGPGGGYRIEGSPTVLAVLTCLGTISTPVSSGVRSSEKRALSQLLHSVTGAITPVLRRKIRSLNMELAATELHALDSRPQGVVN